MHGLVVTQFQDSSADGGGPGVGVCRRQGEGSRAGLRQRASDAGQSRCESHILTIRVQGVGLAGGCAEPGGVIRGIAGTVPEFAATKANGPRGSQRVAAPESEDAAVDVRATIIGIRTGECDCARGGLRQDRPGAAQIRADGAALRGEGGASEHPVIDLRPVFQTDRAHRLAREAQIEDGRASVHRERTRRGPEDPRARDGQRASSYRGAAIIGVRAGEGDRACGGLCQRGSAAGQRRAYRSAFHGKGCAGEGAVVDRRPAFQTDCTHRLAGGAQIDDGRCPVHRERAGGRAERAAAGEDQRTGGDRGAARIAIGGADGHVAGSAFDQVRAASDAKGSREHVGFGVVAESNFAGCDARRIDADRDRSRRQGRIIEKRRSPGEKIDLG